MTVARVALVLQLVIVGVAIGLFAGNPTLYIAIPLAIAGGVICALRLHWTRLS